MFNVEYFQNHTHHYGKKYLLTLYHIGLWNGVKSYTVECEHGLKIYDVLDPETNDSNKHIAQYLNE